MRSQEIFVKTRQEPEQKFPQPLPEKLHLHFPEKRRSFMERERNERIGACACRERKCEKGKESGLQC